MFNYQNLPSLKNTATIVVLLVLTIGFAIAVFAAAIVPLTWVFGIINGRGYSQTCDVSETLFKLNQLGRWTWAVLLGLTIIYHLFLL